MRINLLYAVLLFSNLAIAQNIESKLKQDINNKFPNLVITNINKAPIPGFYELEAEDQEILYISDNGQYIFQGDLLDIRQQDRQQMNLTENKRKHLRKTIINNVARQDMIIFKAKDNNPKSYVTVFTDLDCHYCRTFHQQEAQKLNDLGIELRYLSFPRTGIGSDSYKKAMQIWCSKDKTASFNRTINQSSINADKQDSFSCTETILSNQFLIGKKLGIKGTPSIILPDGTIIPGYIPATELSKHAIAHNQL